MMQLYASWSFWHVTLQKPDSANFPEVEAFQKNTVLAKNLLCCFLILKSSKVTKLSIFKKIITHSQRARAERVFRIVVVVSRHGSMISVNLNRKVIFYMYNYYSNTFRLVNYIYLGNIKKRKVLRFFCGSV